MLSIPMNGKLFGQSAGSVTAKKTKMKSLFKNIEPRRIAVTFALEHPEIPEVLLCGDSFDGFKDRNIRTDGLTSRFRPVDADGKEQDSGRVHSMWMLTKMMDAGGGER